MKSIYGPQVLLPHISQKSKRATVRLPEKHKGGSLSGSLETLQIYRKTKTTRTPRQQQLDKEAAKLRAPPCPSPVHSVRTASPNDPGTNQPNLKKVVPVNKLNTKRGKLPSLARPKQEKMDDVDRTSNSNINTVHTVSPALPAITGLTQHPATVPKMTVQRKNKTTNLPPPEESMNVLSYQLLELPGHEQQKPWQQSFNYDNYQHSKFTKAKYLDKSLSIVEGPGTKMEVVWDYNRFLYLNVKL